MRRTHSLERQRFRPCAADAESNVMAFIDQRFYGEMTLAGPQSQRITGQLSFLGLQHFIAVVIRVPVWYGIQEFNVPHAFL